ncbi:hypothetical protein SAMD00019534_120890, partial [Acytostelium subglobosum LB1]|uniref:hypothetical protein n=1 Tax=Acytostelium subglobosum LB1 TaxID=1410327 RepID=UPI00064502F6
STTRRTYSTMSDNTTTISTSTSTQTSHQGGGHTDHKFTNRLIHEKSPYLLQHAHNPVDWFPWGKEAFEKAKKEDKMIFLSVGYSTCHWCHVMERESFESEDIAKVMNELFVNIKVDREERPDIDKIYMTYITETTGHGGWPMSVWLTPQLEPVTGGTYFAPAAKYGRPGFPDMCKKINSLWTNNRQMVTERGATFISFLKEEKPQGNKEVALSEHTIDLCHKKLVEQFDPEFGGFSDAPKFPRTSIFNFLHRVYRQYPANKYDTLTKLHFTLRKMAMGGMYDHLGGGFHRYSVTPDWKVPHFEKMLYDQGQIATVYLDAYQISKDTFFKDVATGVLDYVLKDLTHHDGGFYSAEDADSLMENGEKGEGAFYVWTELEIKNILKDDAEVFSYIYGIQSGGNVSAEEDPHAEFVDKNIVMQFHTFQECADKFKQSLEEITSSVERSKAKLLVERAKRPRPHLDDKVITAWNGLMISAFAKAYQLLDEPKYLEAAKRAIEFIRTNLYNQEKHTLIRNYREGPSNVDGFADDYAFFIQALLDMYESSCDISYLRWAYELQKKQDELFWDTEGHGYFSSSGLDNSILSRQKEEHDGAEPSCQSISCLNLLRLSSMLYNPDYQEKARLTLESCSLYLHRAPIVFPQMVCGLMTYLEPNYSLSLVGEKDSADFKAILSTVHQFYLPNKVLLFKNTEQPADMDFFGEESIQNKSLPQYSKLYGKATLYTCSSEKVCFSPINDVEAVKKQCTTIIDKTTHDFG